MAQTLGLLLLLFSLIFSTIPPSYSSGASSSPQALVAPITKDAVTSLYSITLNNHSPFLLDIGGTFLWSLCPPNHTTVPCGSRSCELAHAFPSPLCHGIPSPIRHPCSCLVTTVNPISGRCALGDLTTTSVTISTTAGRNPTAPVTADNFFSLCASPTTIARPLPVGSRGVAGLSRSELALPSQFASRLSIQNQFAICLPSTSRAPGVAFFGKKPFYLLPPTGPEATTILSYTHLKRNKYNPNYYIGLEGIAVNGVSVQFLARMLVFDSLGHGGVQLSTAIPYTALRTQIYRSFVTAYAKAINRIPRARKVKPFDLCVKSSALGSTRVGYGVPQIDLMLPKEKNWTVFGANSFKQVTADTACLAFVDGGPKAKQAIVIGAYQMENNFLLFDLEKSRLGFSSSLFFIRTTCSNFNFTRGNQLT